MSSRVPLPRYRGVAERRASRVRQVLARLGTLATDAARMGMERWTPAMTRVVQEAIEELDQLGLDRARAVAAEVLGSLTGIAGVAGSVVRAGPTPGQDGAAARRASRSLYARVAPGRVAERAVELDPLARCARLSRALLKLALLADATRAYPAGPAPRALVEPLLRTALEPDERPLLKGRVLVPLCAVAGAPGERLAFEPGGLGLVTVTGELDASVCALARRVVLGHGAGLPRAILRGGTPGVPIGVDTDRRILASAAPDLEVVLRAALRELGDPFVAAVAPCLVGPLKLLRSDTHLRLDILADRHDRVCTVPGPLVAEDGPAPGATAWYILGAPRSREGQLELAPLLVWSCRHGRAGRRLEAVPSAAADTSISGDEVLDDCARALAALQSSGVSRGLSSRGAVKDIAESVASRGYTSLASKLHALVQRDDPDSQSALLLHGAMHLVDRLREGPRVAVRVTDGT